MFHNFGLPHNPVVLLVQPPIRDFYLTSKRTVPYGLLSVAASIREVNVNVKVFDALATGKSRQEKGPPEFAYLDRFYGKPDISPFALFHGFKRYGYSYQHLEKVVLESKASVVGISSLFTAYSDEALEAAVTVKKALPECVVIMGGHHPTEFPEKVMECSAVDFLIRGEGEEAFPLLIDKLRKNGDFRSVPGIVFRNQDGSLFIDTPAAVKDPEKLPPPAFDMSNKTWYRRGQKGSVVVVASRGCPMKCSYCSLANSRVPYRIRSLESVMREIDLAVNILNAGFIDFEDENISLDRRWFRELMSAIATRYGGKIELRAMNGLYPPTLDEPTVKLMKAAGFKTLNLSGGSSSVEQLRAFRRQDVTKSIGHAMNLAKKHGLETVCYMIAGAYGQTAESSLADLVYLAKSPSLAGLSIFYPAPGSNDCEYLGKKGLLPDRFSLWRSSALPCPGPATRLEVATLLRLTRIVNFIKSFEKRENQLPKYDSPYETAETPVFPERLEVGRKLLSLFLNDGIIRGVAHDGEIYEHEVSLDLTISFLERIGRDGIKKALRL